jgi:uncharacterized protein YecE (DUF72 family)
MIFTVNTKPAPWRPGILNFKYKKNCMNKRWLIGCSGFHYKDWKGVFYPEKLPQSKWFGHYCTRFNTLELNSTFYRFPTLAMLENWYQKSPMSFTFSLKAPRLITHYKQFKDCSELLHDFYSTIKTGLKEKLGAVLFQLPGKIIYSEETLQRILQSLDPGFTNVVEFRHNSWWTSHVYEQMASRSVIFCGVSHPQLPNEMIQNNPTIYYRFHGVPRLYYDEYDSNVIADASYSLKKNLQLEKAYIYFNNTAGMGAIHNAEQLISAMEISEKIIV